MRFECSELWQFREAHFLISFLLLQKRQRESTTEWQTPRRPRDKTGACPACLPQDYNPESKPIHMRVNSVAPFLIEIKGIMTYVLWLTQSQRCISNDETQKHINYKIIVSQKNGMCESVVKSMKSWTHSDSVLGCVDLLIRRFQRCVICFCLHKGDSTGSQKTFVYLLFTSSMRTA